MKTGGMEVMCDGCGVMILPMHPTAIFATLRGPIIHHKKLDLCGVRCLKLWAETHTDAAEAIGSVRDQDTVPPFQETAS